MHTTSTVSSFAPSSTFPALLGGFNVFWVFAGPIWNSTQVFLVTCEGLELLWSPFQRHKIKDTGKPGDLHSQTVSAWLCPWLAATPGSYFLQGGQKGCSRHHPPSSRRCPPTPVDGRWSHWSTGTSHFPAVAPSKNNRTFNLPATFPVSTS